MRTTVKDVNWQDQQALWFAGLKPVAGERSLSKKLPENYLRIVEQAIQLKKEVTRRSVEQINFILEQEKRESSSKRFCKPHRMMLLQGDIKYGCKLPIGKNGAMVQTYLSSAIDDHSRYVIQSQFYDNQEESIVEDTFRKVILKAGKFDTAYFDNGSQYVAKQLKLSLAKLGITVRHAPVRSGKSKGKMEKFHQVADAFLREVKIHKIKTLEELNSYWGMYLEEYYHKTSHEGIRDELEDTLDSFRYCLYAVTKSLKIILLCLFGVCHNQVISQFRYSLPHPLIPVFPLASPAVAGLSSTLIRHPCSSPLTFP
ncbi:transposase [Enterocloster clostridioformis]|jgi:putative transposase|uniref:Transposase n=2 Tax=Enterocloster clostridioformis TaxID=1531 RepID=A0A2X2UE04_9FIRM|nr:DDE-type integrase/transposase/recombinase [Enterocloster clostridioformis]SQB14664.1 transposase [Enterocloster clostridioformis]